MRTVNRTTRLSARLTPEEMSELNTLSFALGLSKTEAVVAAIRRALDDVDLNDIEIRWNGEGGADNGTEKGAD